MTRSRRQWSSWTKIVVLITLGAFCASAYYADEFNKINLEPADWEEVQRVFGSDLLCPYFAMKNEIPGWWFNADTQECVLGKIKAKNTLVWGDNGFGLQVQVTTKHLKEMRMKGSNVVIIGGGARYSDIYNLNLDSEEMNTSFISPGFGQAIGGPSSYPYALQTNNGFLVCGGKDNEDSCWHLPFGSPDWNSLTIKMKQKRFYGGRSMVRGALFVTGGRIGTVRMSSTEMFNGRDWVDAKDLPNPVSGHCQVTLSDKRVMIMGGVGASGLRSDVYISNSDQSEWTRKADLPFPGRQFMSCVVVKSSAGTDAVLAVGGQDVSVLSDAAMYNVSDDTWAVDDPLPVTAMGSIGIASDDGKKAFFFVSSSNLWFKFLPEADPGSRWVSMGAFDKGRFETFAKLTNGV